MSLTQGLYGQTPEVAVEVALASVKFFRQQQAIAEQAREMEAMRREKAMTKRMDKVRSIRAGVCTCACFAGNGNTPQTAVDHTYPALH